MKEDQVIALIPHFSTSIWLIQSTHYPLSSVFSLFVTQRNKFPTECESYVKLQELLAPRLEKELWKPDADKGNGTV